MKLSTIAGLALAALIFPQQTARAEDMTVGGRYLPQVVASSKAHRDALEKLIKGKPGIPNWVRNMITRDRYVALASVLLPVDGKPRERFDACEPKNCSGSRIVILYSPDGKYAVMAISDEKRGEILLGSPDAAERQILVAPPQ